MKQVYKILILLVFDQIRKDLLDFEHLESTLSAFASRRNSRESEFNVKVKESPHDFEKISPSSNFSGFINLSSIHASLPVLLVAKLFGGG